MIPAWIWLAMLAASQLAALPPQNGWTATVNDTQMQCAMQADCGIMDCVITLYCDKPVVVTNGG